MDKTRDYRTALVLQGGGALGAYEYGVLKALYETRPHFTPAVVTGISIGAINAAVLVGAKGDPLRMLDHVWRQRFTALPPFPLSVKALSESLLLPEVQKYLSVWGNAGMYALRPEFLYAPLLATSIYTLAPLRQTLEEVVDLKKLNDRAAPRVAVCAVNVATGELTTFDNTEGLSFEHILASGSLPPSFPMTRIYGQSYWDGGLVGNTPLSLAINYLEALAGGNPQVGRELIVVELFPMQARLPQTLDEVLMRAAQLAFTSKLTLDQQLFAKFNDFVDLIHRIDRVLQALPTPEAQQLREHPGYAALVRHQKIDALTVITFRADARLALPGDFSTASIEARIAAGYKDALEQGIGEPTPTSVAVARIRSRAVPAR
jgi:NTE family protein